MNEKLNLYRNNFLDKKRLKKVKMDDFRPKFDH